MNTSSSDTPDSPEFLAQVTYFWDRFRGMAGGINEAVLGTFILLIAIRVFNASSLEKSAINGAIWAGMLLMPVGLWIVSTRRLRCNVACTLYTSITGICLTVTLFSRSVETYIILVCLSMIVGVQGYTLLPRILAENYETKSRGRRVGTIFMISGAVFMLFSQVSGIILDKSLSNYRWILASSAVAYFAASYCYSKMPSSRLEKPASRFPYHTLELFFTNLTFMRMALFWALIEFGALMVLPIRMEFVANERYEIAFSNTKITWLLAIVPLTFSLATSRTWGNLFDSFRVQTIQAGMGVFLCLSTLLYFNTHSYWLMLVAMAMFGISLGAQKILNQLWITKIVEPSKVADYISAMSILNGIRGMAAPVFAYWLLAVSNPLMVGFAGSFIVSLGAIGLLLFGRIPHGD